MKMIKRVAIYARVSTDEQSPENQLLELNAVAKRMQWSVKETYVDHGVSGAKGRENRAAFNALCEAAIRGEFDIYYGMVSRSIKPVLTSVDRVSIRYPLKKY